MKRILAALALSLLPSSCATLHGHVTEYHGVMGIRGVPVQYQTTTRYALHLLFIIPLSGDASTSATIESFHEEAAARGAERSRIVQTSSSTYWYIFPPFSFFVHPVSTTVEGEIEGVPEDFELDEDPED